MKFLLLLCSKPELKCDVSPNATPGDGNCLLHGINCLQIWVIFNISTLAIADGMLNNDAFKHCSGESKNENWTELVRDFQFYEDNDDHIMYLRRRFVLGAAELMAGRKGSKRDDKLLFEYSDSEWEYIWSIGQPCSKMGPGQFRVLKTVREIQSRQTLHPKFS